MTFRLFLCRHAKSPAVNSRVEEARDPGLLPEARTGADGIAAMVSRIPMSYVATSPRRRCIETAQMARLRRPMVAKAFGPIEGAEFETLVNVLRGTGSAADRQSHERHFSGARAFMPLLRELDHEIEVLAASLNGNALVVTHAEIIAYATARWVGIESESLGPVQPGSLTVIEFGARNRLLSYNAISAAQLLVH